MSQSAAVGTGLATVGLTDVKYGCDTCDTAIFVLRPGNGNLALICHGRRMTPRGPRWCGEAPVARNSGMIAGRCYADHATGLIVRCTSSGSGIASCNSRELTPLAPGVWP
jgi:hypothetical protein